MGDFVSLGDISNKFIFIIVFLGMFVILVMAMPPGFYATAPDYEGYLPPDYLEGKLNAENIRTLIYWDNTTSDVNSGSELHIERGEMETVDIEVYWQRLSGDFDQWIMHKYWYEWGFWKKTQDVLPKNPQNSRYSPKWLCEDDIFHEDNLDESGNFSRIEMHDNAFNYVCFVTFDETEYSNLEEAIDDGHVIINMGMGWEYESGALSGWDLIARLLFFQAPKIHPALNAIIALPIWACISFLIFGIVMMIVKALPFT